MYRLGLEAILGLRRLGNTLIFRPCIPRDWPSFSLSYRFGGSLYRIRVNNPGAAREEVQEVSLDGKLLADPQIQLQDDGQEHQVVVTLH
jgi:cellobiose phosphorylase